MIFVDSSVWIDFFNGVQSVETLEFKQGIRSKWVLTGDVVIAEVLQGATSERAAAAMQADMTAFKVVQVVDRDIAIQSARNYRLLRGKGVTVRKTVDALIATRCIKEGWRLLHRDRDFEPFVTHLGLRPALRLS